MACTLQSTFKCTLQEYVERSILYEFLFASKSNQRENDGEILNSIRRKRERLSLQCPPQILLISLQIKMCAKYVGQFVLQLFIYIFVALNPVVFVR